MSLPARARSGSLGALPRRGCTTSLARPRRRPTTPRARRSGRRRIEYGFLPLNHEMTRIDVRQMRATYLGPRGYLRDYTVRGYQAERFAQLLDLARARGIRRGRDQHAGHHRTRGVPSRRPPALRRATATYLQTATAAHGARFVDYNDHSLWQEPQDFADTHHLNRTGAEEDLEPGRQRRAHPRAARPGLAEAMRSPVTARSRASSRRAASRRV